IIKNIRLAASSPVLLTNKIVAKAHRAPNRRAAIESLFNSDIANVNCAACDKTASEHQPARCSALAASDSALSPRKRSSSTATAKSNVVSSLLKARSFQCGSCKRCWHGDCAGFTSDSYLCSDETVICRMCRNDQINKSSNTTAKKQQELYEQLVRADRCGGGFEFSDDDDEEPSWHPSSDDDDDDDIVTSSSDSDSSSGDEGGGDGEPDNANVTVVVATPKNNLSYSNNNNNNNTSSPSSFSHRQLAPVLVTNKVKVAAATTAAAKPAAPEVVRPVVIESGCDADKVPAPAADTCCAGCSIKYDKHEHGNSTYGKFSSIQVALRGQLPKTPAAFVKCKSCACYFFGDCTGLPAKSLPATYAATGVLSTRFFQRDGKSDMRLCLCSTCSASSSDAALGVISLANLAYNNLPTMAAAASPKTSGAGVTNAPSQRDDYRNNKSNVENEENDDDGFGSIRNAARDPEPASPAPRCPTSTSQPPAAFSCVSPSSSSSSS
ncbi:MAG: hypothetical protein AAB263_04385, partial [Planctomycetota bacterium]